LSDDKVESSTSRRRKDEILGMDKTNLALALAGLAAGVVAFSFLPKAMKMMQGMAQQQQPLPPPEQYQPPPPPPQPDEQQEEYAALEEGQPMVRRRRKKEYMLERDPLKQPRKVAVYRGEDEVQSVDEDDMSRISIND
jgi:hypothetical protein